jgi:hypothetical protein
MNISLLRNPALVHTHKQEVCSLLETTIMATASRSVLQSGQTSRPRHHDVNRCVGAAPASPMRLIGVAVGQTSGERSGHRRPALRRRQSSKAFLFEAVKYQSTGYFCPFPSR